MKDRICNFLIVLGLAALVVGAGYREYLIHNGRLTSDMNADGHSITNLPGGFFPVESVNGMTGAVTVPPTDLSPAIAHADAAISDFARTNAVVSGGPYLALTGGVMNVARGSSGIVVRDPGPSLGGVAQRAWLGIGRFGVGPTLVNLGLEISGDWFDVSKSMFPGVLRLRLPTEGDWFSDESGFPVEGGTLALRGDIPPSVSNVVTKSYVEDLGIESGIQEESDPVWSSEKANYATASEVADLRTESSLVYRLYSGSNVVAEVTNYNSQVHAPSLRLMQLNESNEYVTVWTETNGLARTLRDATDYADRAIADYAAPRAWSRTTSGLGADAPSNTTWISTPTTVIAGGFEYAKFVDTYGEVWVLTSNGMAAEFNPDTNAYFRITADDGTPIFSVEKSDAQLVGANAAGITVGESSITIPVPVVSSTAPTMYWSLDITTGVWADESYPPTGATVTWSGTAGSWVCTVSFSGTRPSSMFFKFNFLQEGGVVIRNNATTDISAGIYVDGVKFVPSVSGNNLIWTRQQ